jgi:myo-inositol 2-dehydrogenase / D-chiro-inositol 1-dehydrogenase
VATGVEPSFVDDPEALRTVPQSDLFAVASPTPPMKQFAQRYVSHTISPITEDAELDELQLVVLGLPNDLHCQATLDAAAAGKHVVCEKPLCLNLHQADQMIEACGTAGVKLMYAEELCFAPKYVRLKKLLDDGALGRPTLIKQSEKHKRTPRCSLLGCGPLGRRCRHGHGLPRHRVLSLDLGKPRIRFYAQMATQVHADKTRGDDNALLILEDGGSRIGRRKLDGRHGRSGRSARFWRCCLRRSFAP